MSIKQEGFTLIELVVVMAVVLILLSFASLNLFNIPNGATVTGTTDTLLSDMKTQQIKAMTGDTEGRGTPDVYGIYFSSTSYTLFHGMSYNPNDTSNFVSSLPANYSLTTTLPNSTLIFAMGSGEISNFIIGNNTVTIRNNASGQQKTILLNTYGTITNIQ